MSRPMVTNHNDQSKPDGDETTALIVPVPEADPAVEPWRRRYTKGGPRGMPPHVTVLYPFTPAGALDESALNALAHVIARRRAFTFALPSLDRFHDGVLVLSVDPREPFNALIGDVCAAFPAFEPYGGQFAPEEVIPHCTVAVAASYPSGISDADEEIFMEAESDLAPVLPINSSASAVWLMADTSEGWEKLGTFALAGSAATRGQQ
ncbi:MAG: 2'-5' RNA ligase family protein [Actinomycetota bacterium]